MTDHGSHRLQRSYKIRFVVDSPFLLYPLKKKGKIYSAIASIYFLLKT